MNVVTRPMDRCWYVDETTGLPASSTVPAARGGQGPVVRAAQPALSMPGYHYMFDRGDPLSIQARMSFEKRQAPKTVRAG